MKPLINHICLLISIIASSNACSIVDERNETLLEDEVITKVENSITKFDDVCRYKLSENEIKAFVLYYYDNKNIKSIIPYSVGKDTVCFIVNFKDGWKIISSDSRTSPVLAECPYGSVDERSIQDKPIQIILSDCRDKIMCLRDEIGDLNSSFISIWQPFKKKMNSTLQKNNRDSDAHWIKVFVSSTSDTTTIETIDHLLQTKWGQASPWNTKTPVNSLGQHCKAGCVAVAVGQVMYYFNQVFGGPSGLYETVTIDTQYPFPSRDQIRLSNYNLNSSRWNSMSLTSNSTGNTTYVADLLAYVGYEFNTSYSLLISTATINTTKLNSVRMSGDRCAYSQTVLPTLVQNLEDSKPVLAEGMSNSSAHAWVIDGYSHDQVSVSSTFNYYYVNDPYSLNGVYNGLPIMGIYNDEEMNSILPNHVNGSQVIEYNTINIHYFLMNWGEYNGAYDQIRVDQQLWILNGVAFNTNRYITYNLSEF